MKRAVIKAFSAHALTLTVEANKFLLEELTRRIPALGGANVDGNAGLEEAQVLLNQLLGSADKSKRT